MQACAYVTPVFVVVISSIESRLLLHHYIIELMLALSIHDIRFTCAHILTQMSISVYNIECGYYITDCGLMHV